MSDIVRYADRALIFGGATDTSVPYRAGTLRAEGAFRTEELQSGAKLLPDIVQVTGKSPRIRAAVLDPSLVTEWTKFGSGETITSVKGIWQAFAEDGAFGAGYISVALAGGVLIPLDLSAAADRAAVLNLMAVGKFISGVGAVVGTDSASPATVSKAFYPTSITIGGVAVTQVRDLNVSWNYRIQDDDQLEPTYYYYDQARKTGTANVKDLSKVTAARLEDGVNESISLLFTDANNSSNTVTVSLGTAHVTAVIDGDIATINFDEVA